MPKKLTVLIEDDLDEKFREAVFKSKGITRARNHWGTIKFQNKHNWYGRSRNARRNEGSALARGLR